MKRHKTNPINAPLDSASIAAGIGGAFSASAKRKRHNEHRLFHDVPIGKLPLDELPIATRTKPIGDLEPRDLVRLSLPPAA